MANTTRNTFPIRVRGELADLLEDYVIREGLSNRTEAVNRLLTLGLRGQLGVMTSAPMIGGGMPTPRLEPNSSELDSFLGGL